MRVQIRYTVDVDDEARQAINEYYGRPGLATREQVQRWYRTYGESMNDDLGTSIDDFHRPAGPE